MRAGSADDVDLRFERAGRVGRNAPGETDGREYCTGSRNAVADGQVARLVHGDGAHPTVAGIGRERTLLRNDRSAAGILDFIPADTSSRTRHYRVIHNQ